MSDNEIKFQFHDISYEVYGKYQHCTKRWDGLWWSDGDTILGKGFGAKPSPWQDTEGQRRLAKLLSTTWLRFVWP